MIRVDDFDRTLPGWFEQDATSPAPEDLLERVTLATATRRPRPRAVAALRQGLAAPSPFGDGLARPIVRLVVVAAVALLAIAGIAIVGGQRSLLQDPAPPTGVEDTLPTLVVESLGPSELSAFGRGGSALTGPMTQARTSHTATSLADGRVLIAGGFSGWPGQDSSSAELFDPESRTFTTAGRMTSQRSGHTAVRLADGRILLVGGTDDNGNALASAEIYDPRAGTSVATGSMANGRYKAVTIGLQDGRVAIVGGGDVGPGTPAPTSTVEYFDPVSGRFEPGPLVPVLERADADAVLLEDGRLFISGGHDLGDAPYGDAEIFGAAAIYDPLSGDVEAIPLRGAGLIHENAGTYVAGAVRVADGRVLVAVDLPDQEGWSLVFVDSRTRATMPGGRLAGYPIAGLTTMHDGRVLILTSQRADCGNVEASVFNPRTMVLEHVGRIPDLGTCNGPGHPSVTSLDDGLVLIAGGKASGGTTASAASLIRAVLGQ